MISGPLVWRTREHIARDGVAHHALTLPFISVFLCAIYVIAFYYERRRRDSCGRTARVLAGATANGTGILAAANCSRCCLPRTATLDADCRSRGVSSTPANKTLARSPFGRDTRVCTSLRRFLYARCSAIHTPFTQPALRPLATPFTGLQRTAARTFYAACVRKPYCSPPFPRGLYAFTCGRRGRSGRRVTRTWTTRSPSAGWFARATTGQDAVCSLSGSG